MESSELAADVVIDILSLLPVKSLLRFKGVCKSWCALIESPAFIAKHLNQSNSNNNGNGTLLVKRRRHREDKYTFCLLSGEAFQLSVNLAVDYSQYFKEDRQYLNLEMLGCCNGIICLYDRRCNDLALWNPATREFRALPQSRIPFPPGIVFIDCDHVGFGYDAKTNDYKVVRMVYCQYEKDNEWATDQVEIYSLSTDSWRLIGPVLPVPTQHNYRTRTYLNGIYSWWGKPEPGGEEMLVSFNMSDEVFQTTPLPDVCTDYHVYDKWRIFTVLNESIALILSTYTMERSYEIWVLNEFGVKESWAKLHTIGPVSGCGWPLGFLKNGELLLASSEGQRRCEQLVLCDPVSQEIKNLQVDGADASLDVVVYDESLVSIKGGNDLARTGTE